MSYGLITPLDGEQLEKGLLLAYAACRQPDVLRVLEVGVCHGDTSRGMRDFLRSRGMRMAYVGMDNQRDLPITSPFTIPDDTLASIELVLGDSTETYLTLRDCEPFHFVFIDGCHCVNHVMLDFLHLGDRVADGGIVVFHDAAPRSQGKCDYQGHGPRDAADFGTATREALRLLGLLDNRRSDWAIIDQRWDETFDYGGTAIVQRRCGL